MAVSGNPAAAGQGPKPALRTISKAETWAPLHGRSLRKLAALSGKVAVLQGHFSSMAEQNDAGLFAAPLDELNQNSRGLQRLAQESEEGFVRYLLDNLPHSFQNMLTSKE